MEIVDIRSKFGKLYVKHKQNGKTVQDIITGFQFYFYCDQLEPKDLAVVQKHSRRIENHPSGLLKIYCDNDSLNKFDLEKGKLDAKTIIIKYLLGRNVKTYEADFDPWKRWLLDNQNATICKDPTITFVDLETDDSKDGIVIGRDQILSFAYHVNGKTHFITDKDEHKLLLKLKQLFTKSDIICGWNSSSFDIPYALERFNAYGIQFYKSDIVHFDLMEIFKKRYKFSDQEALTNFNLENICRLFLGEGKIQHKESIKWLYDNDIVRLEEYNKQDVILLDKLNKKLSILDLIIGVCSESKTPYRNYYISEYIDNYVLLEAQKLGLIMPSNMWKLENRSDSSEKDKFMGGFVQEPILGLHNNVDVYDLNSQYPNAMITFNLSIDTYLGKTQPNNDDWIKTPTGCYFLKSKKGIIPIMLEKLLIKRDLLKLEMKKHSKDSIEYKTLDNTQQIVKIILNGTFGNVGSTYSRYYNLDIAESITGSSQYILKWLHKYSTLKGYTILGSDTDSLFVKESK